MVLASGLTFRQIHATRSRGGWHLRTLHLRQHKRQERARARKMLTENDAPDEDRPECHRSALVLRHDLVWSPGSVQGKSHGGTHNDIGRTTIVIASSSIDTASTPREHKSGAIQTLQWFLQLRNSNCHSRRVQVDSSVREYRERRKPMGDHDQTHEYVPCACGCYILPHCCSSILSVLLGCTASSNRLDPFGMLSQSGVRFGLSRVGSMCVCLTTCRCRDLSW